MQNTRSRWDGADGTPTLVGSRWDTHSGRREQIRRRSRGYGSRWDTHSGGSHPALLGWVSHLPTRVGIPSGGQFGWVSHLPHHLPYHHGRSLPSESRAGYAHPPWASSDRDPTPPGRNYANDTSESPTHRPRTTAASTTSARAAFDAPCCAARTPSPAATSPTAAAGSRTVCSNLTEIFTVHIYAYAVMSNHYHATADYRPQERLEFTDEEVARRWLRLFPPQHDEELEQAVTALLDDPERLAVLRDRLGDLSWFMRCLNEPIARRANREDDCTGRFWQGRFCSKALPRRPLGMGLHGLRRPQPAARRHGGGGRRSRTHFATAPVGRGCRGARASRRTSRTAGVPRREGRERAAPGASARHDAARSYRAHVEWAAGSLHDASVGKGRAPPTRLRDPNIVARPRGFVPPARPYHYAGTLGTRGRLSRCAPDRTHQPGRRELV